MSFWLAYVDSENLDYSANNLRRSGPSGRVIKGPRIHSNCNGWVKRLAKAIGIRVADPRRATQAKPASSGSLLFDADEIENLDVLSERGALTEEEFNSQKAKLLRGSQKLNPSVLYARPTSDQAALLGNHRMKLGELGEDCSRSRLGSREGAR